MAEARTTATARGARPRTEQFRLLAVGTSWPPETFIGNLFRGLADAGAAVTIACDAEPRADWLPHERVDWLRTHPRKGSASARMARTALATARALAVGWDDARSFGEYARSRSSWPERLRAWDGLLPYAGRRWDLVYFPWNTAAIAHLPLFDAGSPVIVSCRGAQVNVAPHNPERQSIRDGLGATFERAAAVHCVSEAVLLEAVRCGLDRRKAFVIRPAVDEVFFAPPRSRASADVLRVTTTGSIIWRKGFEYALQAVRHALDRGAGVRLDIVGDGPERQRVLFTIDDLGLREHVRLLGNLPPDRVRERLHDSDAFLLSSLSEGISNAALEAMACGLPVVTTDCGGMREAVTDGVEGFVVPVRDADAMGRALARLAAEPEARLRMGKAARDRVVRQFTLKRQIGEFMALCARACRSGSSDPHLHGGT